MANEYIRCLARGAMIPLWRLASYLGISEPTMTRWLREELPEEKRQRILAAIEQLKQENER